MTKQSFYKSLYVQVLIAIAVGITLSHWYPETVVATKPFGDGLVRLIRMTITPIILRTVVTGIAGMQSMRSVSKTGDMALLYFEAVSTVALIIGLIVVNVVQPGTDIRADPDIPGTSKIAIHAAADGKQSTVSFLMNVISSTVVDAFANGDILQVPFSSVLFNYTLHRPGSYGKLVLEFIEHVSRVMFNIIDVIMKVAPIGAFSAMTFIINAYGVGSLMQPGQLILCFHITYILFMLIILGGIIRAHGFSILHFIRYTREELSTVLDTSPSEPALPRMIDKMKKLGCDKSVVDLVIPIDYSSNPDGISIYLTMAAAFTAQATDTPVDITHQITLPLVLLIASKGAAGVTGSGSIVFAAVLPAVGHLPVAGLVLILGINRFMSKTHALTNLVGNGVATVVISKWYKQPDEGTLQRELADGGNTSSLVNDIPAGDREVV